MAEIGDALTEFKQAKPAEKILIIGGGIAVLGIALYLHSKSSSSTPATSAQTSYGTSSGGQQGLQTFPYGSQPVLDSSGNPVAVIGPPPPGSIPTPSNNPTPTPTGNPGQEIGNPIIGNTTPTGPINGPPMSNSPTWQGNPVTASNAPPTLTNGQANLGALSTGESFIPSGPPPPASAWQIQPGQMVIDPNSGQWVPFNPATMGMQGGGGAGNSFMRPKQFGQAMSKPLAKRVAPTRQGTHVAQTYARNRMRQG